MLVLCQLNRELISIHAPREGCDSLICPPGTLCTEFQSTHPARGATAHGTRRRAGTSYFNPRTPRGVRPVDTPEAGTEYDISIHAPREGCDTESATYAECCSNFNPRTPRGVRHMRLPLVTSYTAKFQSTHPARGATFSVDYEDIEAVISIHAPREGCDQHNI